MRASQRQVTRLLAQCICLHCLILLLDCLLRRLGQHIKQFAGLCSSRSASCACWRNLSTSSDDSADHSYRSVPCKTSNSFPLCAPSKSKSRASWRSASVSRASSCSLTACLGVWASTTICRTLLPPEALHALAGATCPRRLMTRQSVAAEGRPDVVATRANADVTGPSRRKSVRDSDTRECF